MRGLLAFAAALLLAGAVFAADIVTMPTANQLRAKEVDVAAYYLGLDLPPGAPGHVLYQTLYLGLTDSLELDLHRADVDGDETSLVVVGSYKVLSETAKQPDLVVGVRNLTREATTLNPAVRDLSRKRSYFISGAKTFFLGEEPGAPLVRAHLSLGTSDWTLLGERRHDGLFGGVQMLFTPTLGGVIQYDGADMITGLTFMPKDTHFTIKAGTFGDHWWVGLSYLNTL